MYKSEIAKKIEQISASSLDEMGYNLVQVRLIEQSKRKTLQVMIEREDEKEITVDDCTKVSHTLSALLDVKDPIEGAYDLEVSSPGIDRPLITAQDFSDHIGHMVKIEMEVPQEGRKRFKGELKSQEENIVQIDQDGTIVTLNIEEMHTARLVLTDALIKEHLKAREKAGYGKNTIESIA